MLTGLSNKDKKRALLLVLIGGLVVLLGNKFLFPWIQATAGISHCFSYFGINGSALFLAGLTVFCVAPVLAVCIYGFFLCWRAVKHKQFPPPGRYFISPRRFQRGRLAIARGYAGMMICGIAVPLVVGYGAIGMVPVIKKAAHLKVDSAKCSAFRRAK